MTKFTKEEKEILEQNPNIYAVLEDKIVYSKDFKQKALQEYAQGKSARQIFKEANIDISLISNKSDYTSKMLSKWRKAEKNINIHYPQKNKKSRKTAYQKLLERNEYLEAENEFLKKLSALCDKYGA